MSNPEVSISANAVFGPGSVNIYYCFESRALEGVFDVLNDGHDHQFTGGYDDGIV